MISDVRRTTTVSLAVALALALLATALPAWGQESGDACPAGLPSSGFTDTAGNVHSHAIDCIVGWGITHGVAADRYAPARSVTRAQMASFMARLIDHAGGSLPAPSPQGFTDIDGSVHADRINQLAEAGVVHGTTATTYAPSADVRRDQMATFLVRSVEYITGSPLPAGEDAFTDVAGNTHEDNINRAAEAEFTLGTGDGLYSPRQRVRRDQMAGFLARVLERLVADGHAMPPDFPERTVTLLPGLSFDLPGHPSHWQAQPRSAPDDDYEAHYRDTFATSLTVVIRAARTIDHTLEEQAAFYEEHDYDVPDPWYAEVSVSGADRAVQFGYVSPSGDLGISTVVLEADGIPVEFTYSVYIEDGDRAPTPEQWMATVQSIQVDGPALRAALE